MRNIVDRYIESFDFCDPIQYKGLIITPYTVGEMRSCNLAMYCLSVDPYEFDDLQLLPLKRLEFIITIVNRKNKGKMPSNPKIAEQYDLVCSSFVHLCSTLFSSYTFRFGDPLKPKRKNAITFLSNEDRLKFITLSVSEFEDMADLILYQNAVDMSYRDVPYGLRKDIRRRQAANAKRKNAQKVDIEKLIDVVAYKMGDFSYAQIREMPIRKFLNHVDNIRNEQEYVILSHPMRDSSKLKHWMYDGYDRDGFKSYIQSEADALKEIGQVEGLKN